MPLLSPDDRKYILDQLRLAPDEILADAMLALNAARDKIVAVRKLTIQPAVLGVALGVDPATPGSDKTVVADVVVPPRKNVSPGPSSITKIGTQTKADLREALDKGVQPPDKYAEHLKLLWARGEVKFDGKEYYL